MSDSLIVCASCGKTNSIEAGRADQARCGSCSEALFEPWVAEIGAERLDQILKSSTLPVLLDVSATWCGPCKFMHPHLEAVGEEMVGQLRIVKIDGDADAPKVGELGVRGFPTLILYEKGEEVARRAGAMPKAAIRAWLEGALTDAQSAE